MILYQNCSKFVQYIQNVHEFHCISWSVGYKKEKSLKENILKNNECRCHRP